ILPPAMDAYLRMVGVVQFRLHNDKRNTWIVVAGLNGGSAVFQEGWGRFLLGNGLKEGDTVLFDHVGLHIFNMDPPFMVRIDSLENPITVFPQSADAYIRRRKYKDLHVYNYNWDQWNVGIVVSLGNVIFQKGWRSFLHDNEIQEGDTHIFKHVCLNMFELNIFNKKGGLKTPPEKGDLPPYNGQNDFMT
ncbi:B3 domain-containing protein, partial [Striga asiatica]